MQVDPQTTTVGQADMNVARGPWPMSMCLAGIRSVEVVLPDLPVWHLSPLLLNYSWVGRLIEFSV